MLLRDLRLGGCMQSRAGLQTSFSSQMKEISMKNTFCNEIANVIPDIFETEFNIATL